MLVKVTDGTGVGVQGGQRFIALFLGGAAFVVKLQDLVDEGDIGEVLDGQALDHLFSVFTDVGYY